MMVMIGPTSSERALAVGLLWMLCMTPSNAEAESVEYRRAPPAIQKILDAPLPPRPNISPQGRYLLLARRNTYPPIADLAAPMHALAGLRINPRNNGLHRHDYDVELELRRLPDGRARRVRLPAGARVGYPRWNVTGTLVALTNVTPTSVDLWLLDTRTARARRVRGLRLNPVLGRTVTWMGDQRTLLVKAIPARRAAPPPEPRVPAGPHVEQSTRTTSASSTYERRDLLKGPHDADLFQYHATSELALVDARSLKVTRIGSPAVFHDVRPSPDGRYILVRKIRRPYSFLRTCWRFGASVEVWNRRGRLVQRVATLPLAEEVPIHGVRIGPRHVRWRATAPATLVYAEALDGGDTYRKVPHHDRLLVMPVGKPARELLRTKHRFVGISWIEGGGEALVYDVDQDRHRYTAHLVDVDRRPLRPRLVWDLNYKDRYRNPGYPVHRMLPSGALAVRVHRGAIFLSGRGASPQGNRPFFDRLDLKTFRTERLFRSGPDVVEYFRGGLDPASGRFYTVHQSPTRPPNVHLRTLGAPVAGPTRPGEAVYSSSSRALTHVPDPTPGLRRIGKRLVKYRRADGVPLSFTLYLPPGYKPGTRLPTVVWAYPLDYTETGAAGQVSAWTREFVTIVGPSPIFLALQGYAVLYNAAMPVVGPTRTAYDTFIQQITANSKAAIDKAVALGVTDRDRVGIIGHSHGALMAANLLAWTDLFRAGVARSGAYNHTLRPFGFQNERRTLYQARKTYLKLSPLINADRIDEPLLLIHGEIDANPGTVTLQSRKLFDALRGLGARARLVILPFESHGYRARESTEHVLYETVTWLDRYLKNAPPRRARDGTPGS
jgi:dipeptidyl aminopeptidase/acylaminoacyl peptidase